MNKAALLKDLFEKYSQPIFRLCLRYTKSEPEAEDLMMDVFVKLDANLDSFRKESEMFTWMYRIAINRCIDFVRANKRHRELEEMHLPKEEPGEYHFEDKMLNRMDLRRALEQLSESERTLLMMRFGEDMSQDEIAECYKISRPAITKKLNIITKKLQEMFKGNA